METSKVFHRTVTSIRPRTAALTVAWIAKEIPTTTFSTATNPTLRIARIVGGGASMSWIARGAGSDTCRVATIGKTPGPPPSRSLVEGASHRCAAAHCRVRHDSSLRDAQVRNTCERVRTNQGERALSPLFASPVLPLRSGIPSFAFAAETTFYIIVLHCKKSNVILPAPS